MADYLSAIIEQDEAPEMVKHFRGFFVVPGNRRQAGSHSRGKRTGDA